MITKGRGRTWKTSNVGIRAAILEELRLFLCTDHSRYKNLRTQGKKLTKDAILFIAGVIGGTLSLPAGVATACVAFIALACLRVGAGTFCRLIPSPAQEQHNAPETKKLKRRRTNVKAIN
jgi:hypothetical protein